FRRVRRGRDTRLGPSRSGLRRRRSLGGSTRPCNPRRRGEGPTQPALPRASRHEDVTECRRRYDSRVTSWNPVAVLRSFSRRLTAIIDQQASIEASLHDLRPRVDALSAENGIAEVAEELSRQRAVLRAIYEDEPGNRLRLWEMRADPDYPRPFEEDD